ncbi:MAG TPA: trehalose-6-phosphate synthase [Patescibacteria group bacterium]|nr:trehalose-6-phosphate synthase [Patescibacteria group bacterium]
MTSFSDLQEFFNSKKMNMIIASDAEPRVHTIKNGKIVIKNSAGGVAVALDPIAQATNATFIARAKSEEEKKTVDKSGFIAINGQYGNYTLKKLFFEKEDVDNYYYGFSNQTLWPMCHVAFEEPTWNDDWFESYKKINKEYANAIKKSLVSNKTNFVWINDYQLALVPHYLGKPKNTIIAMFWHIPWPTWEIFRILPYKKEILTSLLGCDFLAFHRGYQARNFIQTVERELQTRVDDETQKVYFNKYSTIVRNLPMGIDVDVIKNSVEKEETNDGILKEVVKNTLGIKNNSSDPLDNYFEKYKVMLGVSRLDYTKGIKYRFKAIDKFFEENKKYIGKATYLAIIAPSREPIPSYQRVKKQAFDLAEEINKKYQTKDWKPINIIYQVFDRKDIINFYHKADVCIVTPVDDGMNLVSKEFVVASSLSQNPGMLVLSQFAGSAIDLTSALIVNPYDIKEAAVAIKTALEMPKKEKIQRTNKMISLLEENNIYEWGLEFIRQASS